MRPQIKTTTTEIQDGLGNHQITYILTSRGKEIISFTCLKGYSRFTATARQKTYMFYCQGHTIFDLPPHVLKKFQAKGKLLRY